MGKNASIYGVASTVRIWGKTHPNLNESTVRGFRKRYESQIKEASKTKRSPKKVIINKLRGRPCLLGSKIDPLVQKYLKSTRYKGGIVNTNSKSFSKKISAVRKGYYCRHWKTLCPKHFPTHGVKF